MLLDFGKSTCLSERKMYEEIEESHSAFSRIRLQACMLGFGGKKSWFKQSPKATPEVLR
jgi:hypothetical protein